MRFPAINGDRLREGQGQDDENRQGAEERQDDRREEDGQQDEAERAWTALRNMRFDDLDPDPAYAHFGNISLLY
jgi:hypothetical protein